MSTVYELQRIGVNCLERASPQSAAITVDLFLMIVIGGVRSTLYAFPEKRLNDQQQTRFMHLVAMCQTGIPSAYLLGYQEFWSMKLAVTPAVFIPRPETEQLVASALRCIPRDAKWRIADLGTGSGAIALALARERSQSTVVAIDRMPAALAIAKKNAQHHHLRNISFCQGDWLAGLTTPFDCIVSNPPYVAIADPALDSNVLHYEPAAALFGGSSGLDAITTIITSAKTLLRTGGHLILEHGDQQGSAVRELFKHHNYCHIKTENDLNEKERITHGQYS